MTSRWRDTVLRLTVPVGVAAAVLIIVFSAKARGVSDHVGSLTCAGCHASAHETWSGGPHARATDRLKGVHREDRSCVQCHQPSRGSGLTGVQCETCHGGGRYYFAEYVMRDAELARLVGLRDPDETTCLSCHDSNTPRLVPFDYETARERIRHW